MLHSHPLAGKRLPVVLLFPRDGTEQPGELQSSRFNPTRVPSHWPINSYWYLWTMLDAFQKNVSCGSTQWSVHVCRMKCSSRWKNHPMLWKCVALPRSHSQVPGGNRGNRQHQFDSTASNVTVERPLQTESIENTSAEPICAIWSIQLPNFPGKSGLSLELAEQHSFCSIQIGKKKPAAIRLSAIRHASCVSWRRVLPIVRC